MSQSPTEGAVVEPASNEPTGEELQSTAADLNQETISGEPQTQETVSDESAPKQTQQNGGEVEADDSLAKFAKSQGIDELDGLTDREKQLLKVAHDNVKSYRNKSTGSGELTKTSEELSGSQDLAARVERMEYRSFTDEFFSQEGKDRALESQMAQILRDKKQELEPMLGKEQTLAYVHALSRDLPTLYTMASQSTSAAVAQAAKEEGRREERDSIKRQTAAGAPSAHATQSGGTTKAGDIDEEWIRTQYDPRNADHRKLVDTYMAGR